MDFKLQLVSGLDLLLRLPPQHMRRNIDRISLLAPDISEDLFFIADQPLKLAWDPQARKPYLQCEYNRDGDSYHSPWSDTYYLQLRSRSQTTFWLRSLEFKANAAFKIYCDLYYGGGVSSVYFWELDGRAFAGAILFKKTGKGHISKVKGSLDCIHIVEVRERLGRRTAFYKLTSTVMLGLRTQFWISGFVNLGGVLTRQEEQERPLSIGVGGTDHAHLVNLGDMVEEMEKKMWALLQEVFFCRTKDMVRRCLRSLSAGAQKEEVRTRWGLLGRAMAIRRTPRSTEVEEAV